VKTNLENNTYVYKCYMLENHGLWSNLTSVGGPIEVLWYVNNRNLRLAGFLCTIWWHLCNKTAREWNENWV